MGPFSATHQVPASGLSAWTEPDPKQSPVAQLDPGLEVQVIDRTGEWAKVRCSNDWQAWTDGHRLVAVEAAVSVAAPGPSPAPAPAPAQVPAQAPASAAAPAGAGAAVATRPAPAGALSIEDVGIPSLIGAALVIVGSLLKWWTIGPSSVTAWHIPVKFVIAGSAGNGVDTGPFLLVVVLVLLPLLTRRRMPAWLPPLLALVPLLAGLGALIRGLRESPSLHPGIGILLTIAGGLLITIQTPGFASFGLKPRRPR